MSPGIRTLVVFLFVTTVAPYAAAQTAPAVPAAPAADPGSPAAAAASAGGGLAGLCAMIDAKIEACKAKICACPLGQMLTNGAKPINLFAGVKLYHEVSDTHIPYAALDQATRKKLFDHTIRSDASARPRIVSSSGSCRSSGSPSHSRIDRHWRGASITTRTCPSRQRKIGYGPGAGRSRVGS